MSNKKLQISQFCICAALRDFGEKQAGHYSFFLALRVYVYRYAYMGKTFHNLYMQA